MRVLLLTFYYPPDLSAGAFRAVALVDALHRLGDPDLQVDVITTQPNRYRSMAQPTNRHAQTAQTTVRRFALPGHRSGMRDQALSFASFSRQVSQATRGKQWDVVVATSSRLMTAALGRRIAHRVGAPLYLDIRDLFTDTIMDVLGGRPATRVLAPILAAVERRTFRAAARINVVSEGFVDHVRAVAPDTPLAIHPNGVDDEFLAASYDRATHADDLGPLILYAGNIGEGQGLEHVLPDAVRLLGDRARFRIIGDGGRRERLQQAIAGIPSSRIELCSPMSRATLIEQYRSADILFLHLNDYPAFEKVLPSKIFEYAATAKPILAGVGGYAARFLQSNVPGAETFAPGSAHDLVRAFAALPEPGRPIDRRNFCARFSRRDIMDRLAEDIVAVGRGKPHP